jgi:hypothetical protein
VLIIALYVIEIFQIIFDMRYDAMHEVRSNDILELFGSYARVFVFDDVI